MIGKLLTGLCLINLTAQLESQYCEKDGNCADDKTNFDKGLFCSCIFA